MPLRGRLLMHPSFMAMLEGDGRVSVKQVQRIALLFAQAEIWPPGCCEHALAALERFAQRKGFSLTRSVERWALRISRMCVLRSVKLCPSSSTRCAQ